MINDKKFEIIYHKGQADGICSIHHRLSKITTYIIPRARLSYAKNIAGTDRPGIYYLIHDNELYVGQTRNGIARLNDHKRKVFWSKAVMFLSDKKTFSLDIISALEKYAYVQIKNSKRYQLINANEPKFEIDESEKTSINEIYEEIKFVMATLGYQLDVANGSKEPNFSGVEIHTKQNGTKGLGLYEGEMIHVLEGSEIDFSRPCEDKKIQEKRDELLSKGDIVPENGKYILKVPISFKKPSPAGQFVLGGSVNGWVVWFDQEENKLENYREDK